jgi:3-oxoacyl-[acyl-carrier protein] reductase
VDIGLTDMRVLISGASRGIGRAIAETFLAGGASVALCARGEEALAATAKELSELGSVFYRPTDVADAAAVAEFVRGAAEELGGLDVLVVNASAGSVQGPESWQQSFSTDLMSLVHFIAAARGFLAASPVGAVVSIATTAALEAGVLPSADSYGALKAAGLQHALAQARALAPKGIRVNVVSPGPVFFEGGAWEQIQQQFPDLYNGALAGHGLGRLATPQDVASAVAFLASPLASHITGVNLVVDGGFTNRFAY